MAGDIKQLLREAADEPTRPVDAARLVRRARREVLLARTGAAVGSLVVILAAVVLSPLVGDGDGRPVVMDRPDQVTDGQAPEVDQPADELWGRTYESVEVTAEGNDRQLIDGTRLRLTLTQGTPWKEGDLARDDEADGFAEWHAGCNHFGQHLRLAGDKLEFTGGGLTTNMLCAELSEQDQWINQFFNADPSWKLSEGLLELSTSELIIVFEVVDEGSPAPSEEPSTDASLPEGDWQLVAGSVDGDAISPVADEPITLTASGNRGSGWDSCNNYELTVETTATGGVRPVQLDGEDAGCSSPEAGETAERYTAALLRVDRYSLTNGELHLSGDDVELRSSRRQ